METTVFSESQTSPVKKLTIFLFYYCLNNIDILIFKTTNGESLEFRAPFHSQLLKKHQLLIWKWFSAVTSFLAYYVVVYDIQDERAEI